MKTEYDVVVVGAGPAGSMAARYAAEKGASVVLLERDREIGVPVRCAEATSLPGLRKYVEIRDHWRAVIATKLRFVAPDSNAVTVDSPEKSIVLNRRIFDHDLAADAARQGAEVYTKANVTDVLFSDNKLPIVKLTYIGREKEITAKIVIAADGVESRIARMAGIRTQTKFEDTEPCAQMLIEDIEIVPDRLDFYFGSELAPGGYVWVFPKSDRSANVGLGFNAALSNGKTALQLLEKFVADKFPNGKILTTVAGGVPVANTLKKIVTDNFMVVGDAARQVNPLSGGGILSGMAAGQIAGQVAAQAIQNGDYSQKILNAYQKEWKKRIGQEHDKYFRFKEYVVNMKDQDFNDLADILLKIEPSEISVLTVFKVAVRKKPSLIIDAIKLFSRQALNA